MEINKLIRDMRGLDKHTIAFSINWALRDAFPDLALLETGDCSFDPDGYAYFGHCCLEQNAELHSEVVTSWNSDTNTSEASFENATFDVEWRGSRFQMLRLSWKEQYSTVRFHWLFGSDANVLSSFFDTVSEWQRPLEPSVDVFEDGHWARSRTLHQAIKSTTLENLILVAGLKEEIQADLSQFFESRAVYDRYKIPWKRGVLFVGPPGNGKTHAVKGLINWLDKPALYVKSLKSMHYTEHQMMHSVFSQARSTTPCILVFEDLETIVTPQNRAYFLNELDGFALNTGILVVATTNHPELLDPSIMDRPSRFDRKYSFDLPEIAERTAYLAAWNGRIDPDLRLTEAGQTEVAAGTDGFSFAYLKELIMASMMRWINHTEKPHMDDVMRPQIEVLRSQMSSSEDSVPDLIDSDEAVDDGMTGHTRAHLAFIRRYRMPR